MATSPTPTNDKRAQFAKNLEATEQKEIRRGRKPKTEQTTPKTSSKHTKVTLEQMRKRYKELLEGNAKGTISEEALQEIRTALAIIREQLDSLQNKSYAEKSESARKIWAQIKQIKNYKKLPLEESGEFYQLINDKRLSTLRVYVDWFSTCIANSRIIRGAESLYVGAIHDAINQAESVETLQMLMKRITTEMQRESAMVWDGAKTGIKSKTRILQAKTSRSLPEEIKAIIVSIAKGEINIQSAETIIGDIAKQRATNSSSKLASVALTPGQYEAHLKRQIIEGIADNSMGQHTIKKKPSIAIETIQSLCGCNQEEAIEAVLRNLISARETTKADLLLLNSEVTGALQPKQLEQIKKELAIAKVAKSVLEAMEESKEHKEDNANTLAAIMYCIESEKIDPKLVKLGISKDGSRTITLEDLMTNRKEKVRS